MEIWPYRPHTQCQVPDIALSQGLALQHLNTAHTHTYKSQRKLYGEHRRALKWTWGLVMYMKAEDMTDTSEEEAETKYTTVAVTREDMDRLDSVRTKHLEETDSYRDIINFLVDEKEEREASFEEVLASAIARADENDVERALQRTQSDANWVRQINAEEQE